jgi:hypothetical protein
MGVEFVEADMIQVGWEWFVKKNGGIEACIAALQRFGSDLRGLLINVMIQFARNNFLELFTLHFRNAFNEPSEYLTSMHSVLPSLAEIRMARSELMESDVIDYWLDFCTRESE